MTTLPADLLPEIDRRITAAHSALGTARTGFTEYPTGEALTECETAEATLNELLELRFALTRGVGGAHSRALARARAA
ncbi:hypothetical protein [Geodermatophilus ruber]|uniref:DUF222 domain-containing protein n=1 Tax=Geodermatophilus ruber TaxID=504800 RepID=A0A1I4F9R5_9ACTN|nr:hypothetical protein [Geodermatophilus ruber]SFL14624.1 hypothetical protein SAMN04488085_10746 [Geodermatophilus ruber]